MDTTTTRLAPQRPSTIRRLRALDALALVDTAGVERRLNAGDYHVAEDGDQMVIFEQECDDAPCGRVRAREFWAVIATHPMVQLLW